MSLVALAMLVVSGSEKSVVQDPIPDTKIFCRERR
jgi:hypothetical protein